MPTENINRITLTLRAAAGQTLEQIEPYTQPGAHVSIGRGLAVIDRVLPPEEPVQWGSPKTVRQMISQLQTLDPDLETVALYRLPDDVPGVGGKVRQGHISTSYERMEGQWLGPYKSDGRKVLAFWSKPDPRQEPDGEYLTQPSALGGEPELVAYHCVDEYGQKKVLLPGAEGIGRHIRRGSVLKQLTYMDSACRLQAEVERLRSALKFYAEREHYHFESGNWDTVSGEPLNILWNGEEPDFIEDGTIARNALAEGAKS